MLQFGIIPTSEFLTFLYVITNHATDAIKATFLVNIKFRKLKKKNVRNTNKARQRKQEVLELSSGGIHAGVRRRDSGSRSSWVVSLTNRKNTNTTPRCSCYSYNCRLTTSIVYRKSAKLLTGATCLTVFFICKKNKSHHRQ